MSGAWKVGTGQKIERLYAWVATEPDGGEGVCSDAARRRPNAADRGRHGAHRELARPSGVIAKASGYPVRLVEFSARSVLREAP